MFVSMLKTHLNSGLGKVDFQSYLLSHKYVWVACFGEQGFQNVQLGACECSALPTLLPRSGYYKNIDIIQ